MIFMAMDIISTHIATIGKSVEDNLEILQNLAQLRLVGFPVLLGVSRKSL